MLQYAVPPGYQRQQPIKRPKLGPWLGVIDAILNDDKQRPVKQRHTSKRIFERLKEERGFTGGYTIVKDYVRGAHPPKPFPERSGHSASCSLHHPQDLSTRPRRAIMQNSSAFQYLAIDTIHESTTNPRRTFDEGKLLELAESIKHHGLIQPVTVRPNSEGFELIAGARR
jgi:hypothetical protein